VISLQGKKVEQNQSMMSQSIIKLTPRCFIYRIRAKFKL